MDQSLPAGLGRPGVIAPFLNALGFLTRLPVPQRLLGTVDDAGAAPAALAWFPLVGALIGCITAGTLAVSGLLWPLGLAVLIAVTVELLVTGALHEDGLADCCDALGGWTREDRLSILKDSRIGTYGVLGLILAMALKAFAVYAVVSASGFENWWLWGAAILAAAAVGRGTMVFTIQSIPPVENRESLSRHFAGRLAWRESALSVLWSSAAVAPYALFRPGSFLISLLLWGAGVVLLHRLFRRKLGGLTGDCLGCVCCVSQILVLMGAAARMEW